MNNACNGKLVITSCGNHKKKVILCILSISQFQCKAAIVSYLNMFSWRCKPSVFLDLHCYFVTIIATHFTLKSHELYATSEN